MIDVNFEGLFTVELLHKFYANQLCPDFSITASNQAVNIINSHRLVVKQYHNKLYAGIQSNSGVPFMPIETGMQMTFYMWLNNPLFFNYTNLPGNYDAGKICYFTNRNSNTANGKQFLSSAIASYINTASYAPGDLATDGTGTVFSAIHTNNPGNLHDLTDAGSWASIDKYAYASAADVLQWLPAISTYNFKPAQSAAVVSVLGYNNATDDYTLPVFSQTFPFENPVFSFQLDLSALGAGKYSLTVNGTREWIYINDELIANRPFAVIDIYNEATPVSGNLVDGSGDLLSPSPAYSIYFLNRATVWRYLLASGATGSISDLASTYNFASLPGSITSSTPIPLSSQAQNFKLSVNSNDYTPIPCADPQRLTTFTQAGDTYACSEIFLNY